MLPIVLDTARIKTALVGSGAQATRRLAMLIAAGARDFPIYAPRQPTREFIAVLNAQPLTPRLPSPKELAALQVLYIADTPADEAAALAKTARTAKTLVNVEDDTPHCDFHVPALVRRGDLLLTASTNGASPALARRLKQQLAAQFPPAWAEYVGEIAAARSAWREAGASFTEIGTRTNALIDEKGWLS